MGFSFVDLAKDWDWVASIPIRTREQRLKIPKEIKTYRERGEVFQCFRDSLGYLIIAHRKKRLPDYF